MPQGRPGNLGADGLDAQRAECARRYPNDAGARINCYQDIYTQMYRTGTRPPAPPTGDTYSYGIITPAPDYPYSVLGRTSRADYKRNQLDPTFDPNTRKVLVLLIAGLLLFIAALRYWR
jgi:hypothetical protein